MSADAVNVGHLRALVERIERVEADIKELNADKSDIYKEARGFGYDVRAVRAVVAKRKIDSAEREERDAIFSLYWDALNGASRVHMHEADTFDPETGEITDNSFLGPHSHEVDDGQPHPSSNAGGAKNDGAQTIVGRADDRSDLSITQLEQQDASASQDRNEPISDSEATVTHSDTTLATPDASCKAGEGSLLPLSPAAHSDDDVPDFLKRDTAPARKTAADFRPNCLRPDVCASSGLHHCYQCEKASETMEGELA